MKRFFTFLTASFMMLSAYAQTFNGGTWYSYYDSETHDMWTITSYTIDNVFPPTAGQLQFKWNYTKWGVAVFGSNNTHIYTSTDGGSNTTEIGALTDNTWDTEHSENFSIGANVNWLKWDRPTGNTHYVNLWNIAVPMARHILLSGGTNGKTSVSKTFADAVTVGESASIRADFRSFLTNGDITIAVTEGDATVFRLGDENNTTGALTTSTAGNSYAVGANACASANGTANACANGQLAKIDKYSFQIYFCPKMVGEATATITITDGTSTATITVSGTGAKPAAIEVPVELGYCPDGSVEFHGRTYTAAGTDVINAEGTQRDTIYNVTIVALQPTYGSDQKTIVVGTQETWHGIDLSTYPVGVYDDLMDIMTNAAGCDSIITLTLTVTKANPVMLPVMLSFCQGGSVEYRDRTYTAAGTDVINAQGAERDTIINVTIVELLPTYGHDEKTIVVGTEETWHGIDLSTYAVGVYDDLMDVTTNAAGCDSIITMTLTVIKANTVQVPVNLEFCQGESAEYRGVVYTEAGNYQVRAEGAEADTLFNITVTVNAPLYEEDQTTVYAGENILFDEDGWLALGVLPVENGVYATTKADTAALWFVRYGQTEHGCNAEYKLIVTVEVLDPVTAEYDLSFCEGESAEYRGTTYTAAGTYEVLAEGEIRDTIITVNVVIYNDEVVHMDPRTVAAGDVVKLPDGEWFLGETAVSGSYQTSEADVESGLEFVQYGKTENECEKTTILAVTVTSREAIENIFVDENVEKVFRDGVLYIRRGDKLFNASGKRVE